MEHSAPSSFLSSLAVVLCVAAVTTVVFQKLRKPVLLGYILAGLIVGPHVPIPLVADEAVVHSLSELGVILLLFAVGLEFTVGKLVRVAGSAGLIGLVEVSVCFTLGNAAARLLGWNFREALYAGAIAAISSTTIVAKAFDEQRVGGRLRELVFAILVVEDLLAIMMVAALTPLSAGQLTGAQLAFTAGRLALFLAGVIGVGLLVIPRLVRAIVRLDRPETLTVGCVGICFAVALLAQWLGYSVALGAFLAGSLVAESGEGARIEHLLQPVRDLFAAVFFVSVGMLIDPVLVARNWAAVVALLAVVVVGKIIGVTLPAFLSGAGVRTSIQAGMSLAEIGEFSFIIAALGSSRGAVRPFLYPVAIAVSAVTTLTAPTLVRASGSAAAWVDRKLPRALQTFVALYGAWIERLRAPRPGAGRPRRLVRLLALDAALLAAIAIAAALWSDRLEAFLSARLGLSPRAADLAALLAAVALGLPFVIGIVRLAGALVVTLAAQALPPGEQGKLDLSAAPRRALVVALQILASVALVLPLMAVTRPFLPGLVLAGVGAALLAVLTVRLWRSAAELQGHVRAGAEIVSQAFAQARGSPSTQAAPTPEDPLAPLLSGLGSPVRLLVDPGSPAAGRTLAELDLRGTTGATVLAIRRGEQTLPTPSGAQRLEAGDLLALAGTHEALEAAQALLAGGVQEGA
jgi:CPA2 family monovalent cation:H+ antiporter-2